MTYKSLIVGLGNIGMGYDLGERSGGRVATLARAFFEHSEFELVGGVDTNSSRRQLFQNQYARQSFASLEMALRETDPDVVAVAVPTEAHHRVLSDVLRLVTPKAILCEKPLSYELSEARELVDLTSGAGILLFTNYMRRCDPAVVEIYRRIKCNEISGPIKGVCWYSKGLFNNGSHFVNLFQYWMGKVVSFQVVSAGTLWDGHDPEPSIRIFFEAGEVYFLAASEENFSHNTVELVAANGRLRYEQGNLEWQPVFEDSKNPGNRALNPISERVESNAQRLQWFVVENIARELKGESTSICTGVQGLSTMEILTQIREKI